MKTVYKYPVPPDDTFEMMLPQGAQILTVDLQFGEMQLWALIDPDAPLNRRRFRLAGTGHPIKERNLLYINTFQAHGGALILHLFEILPDAPLLIEAAQ
jgi:hypothetical protein